MNQDYSHLVGRKIENRLPYRLKGSDDHPDFFEVAAIDPDIGITISVAEKPERPVLCLVEPSINAKRRKRAASRSHDAYWKDFCAMVEMIKRGYIDYQWFHHHWLSDGVTNSGQSESQMAAACPFS